MLQIKVLGYYITKH